jgi:hypothetical protein
MVEIPVLAHFAWLLMTVSRFAGITFIFAGVTLFGVYFIGGNARAARSGRSSVPTSSWLGAGPKKAMRIAAVGVFMLILAFVVGLFLPDGT